MDSCKFRLTVFGVITFFGGVFTTQTQMITRVQFMRKCDKNQRLPVDFRNIQLARGPSKDYINITMETKSDLFDSENRPNLVMSLEKCNSKDAMDTCAHLLDFKSSKFCEMIIKVTGVKQFFNCCTPPIGSCPMRKGIYVCKNCVLEAKELHPIPLPEFYWKVTTKIYSKNQLIICLYSEGYLDRMHVSN